MCGTVTWRGTSSGALTTNPFHIVYKLQEGRRKVCSTTWNSYSTTWNGCFSTWNSYFTSWNAKVYYILLVLFLLFRAFASKLRFIELTLTPWVRWKVVETHSCVSANRQAFASSILFSNLTCRDARMRLYTLQWQFTCTSWDSSNLR